ncbi:MAG: AtpZ/AtpI family protein [Lachnospiraceae bacterium]
MGYKKGVWQSLTMVTQFAINMLVPIFLCVALGIFLGNKFQIKWLCIPFFLIGALAGFRNCYIMAKKIYEQDEDDRHHISHP